MLVPQPSPDPRLAAEPIMLKDKRPPEVPRPSTWESGLGQRDGWADGPVSRLCTGK